MLEPAAASLDAVNCVALLEDGRLEGSNTDGAGFLDALRAAGVEPTGRSAVVVGAGGAGRAVIAALGSAGVASLTVVNRSAGPAAAAVALAGPAGRLGTIAEVRAADLVVNATSVGMGVEESPVEPSLLHDGQAVVDLVYHPLDTLLLRSARQVGATTVDGLGMLVHQAAHQLTRWTGLAAPIGAMRAAAEAELARRDAAAAER